MSARVKIDALGRRYISRAKERACLQCGQNCSRTGLGVKYCSRACFYASRKGDFPNRKTRDRTGAELSCSRCGKQFYRKNSHIQATENFCSRKCSNIYHLDQFSVRGQARPSSLEVILYQELDRLGIEYRAQAPIAGFVVDALLPETATAIEVDGAYWHSLPENIERDRRKDAGLRERGLRVVRISEAAARKNIKAALREAAICR